MVIFYYKVTVYKKSNHKFIKKYCKVTKNWYILNSRKVTKSLIKGGKMNNLKVIRKSRRLTQKEMANMLNMSTHTYIKKEKKLDAF